MSDFGIKISKEGYDVSTTGDMNLSFSSEYNMFKVYMSGTAQLSLSNVSGADSDEVTITHNLGYRPVFFLYGERYGDGSSSEFNRKPSNNASAFECIWGVSRENTLSIKIYDAFSTLNQTFDVKYFIMTDSLD